LKNIKKREVMSLKHIIETVGTVGMAALFCWFLLMSATSMNKAYADVTNSGATTNTQTNTSGSNTTISGGYAAETTNTYQSGSSNNTTTNNDTTNTTNNKSTIPVPSAGAPSMSAYSQDVCAVGRSGGLQLPGVGLSGGSTARDMNCERMKLSKLLNDYGMKVAAVAILCQDPRVFEAMEQAGTPCPFEGKIGKEAMDQWNKYDVERPDYKQYVDKMDTRLEIDERIMKEEGILEENASLKTDIKQVAKDNKKLQKEIEKLQKMQAELLAAAEEEASKTEKMILPLPKPKVIVEQPIPDVHTDEVKVEVLEPVEESTEENFNSAGK
tara:strand:+ start:86 stop:1063 length:978 start_codon:yes stop_codon:yes gene_type:complete